MVMSRYSCRTFDILFRVITHWLERSHRLRPWCSIVDCDARVGGTDGVVDHLRDALEAAVACLEVDICGPVVGKVLVEGAGRAGTEFSNVGDGHTRVEGILYSRH